MNHEFKVGQFFVKHIRGGFWQNFHATTGWTDGILRSKDEAFGEAKRKSQELREKAFKAVCSDRKQKRRRETRLSKLVNRD